MDDLLPDLSNLPSEETGIIEPTLQAAANAAENLIGQIQMVPVSSSDIAEAGYDPINFKAQIRFRNNYIYVFSNISPLDWEGFMTSPSKGKYFWMWRRNPVQYPFIRIQ